MKLMLIWFIFCHTFIVSDSQVLHVRHFGSNEIGLPEFIGAWSLDDRTFFRYDHRTATDNTMDAHLPDWLSNEEGHFHWRDINQIARIITMFTKTTLDALKEHENLTVSVQDRGQTYQVHGSCYLNSNGIVKSSLIHGYNGEDFVSFDIPEKTLIAPDLLTVNYVKKKVSGAFDFNNIFFFYTHKCIKKLQILSKYAPWFPTKKVPTVHLFERQRSSDSKVEVTCHVTGFYPREVQVKWLDTEAFSLVEGMSSGEVLPNGDGSYQLRKIMMLSKGDMQSHRYSCLVLHSSVKGNITVTWVPKTQFIIWRISLISASFCLLIMTVSFLAIRMLFRRG